MLRKPAGFAHEAHHVYPGANTVDKPGETASEDRPNRLQDDSASVATRAFRRPATDSKSIGCASSWRPQKATASSRIRWPCRRCSFAPFLFRIESILNRSTQAVRTLGEYELATQLSYFLWSSMLTMN